MDITPQIFNLPFLFVAFSVRVRDRPQLFTRVVEVGGGTTISRKTQG
jgi:hypothetical protein